MARPEDAQASGLCVGIDFGTANSAAALPAAGPGGKARILSIDPEGDDPRLLRSVLFFPGEGTETLVGSEAVRRYLEEGEGRFLQSMKSFLPSTSFQRTEIRRRSYKLEELLSILLRRMRLQVEAEAGGPVTRVVFGRPAVFSPEPAQDRLAQERLAVAAELAGFPPPIFLIEPIAAALAYEEGLDREELVLVGDLGAGTSDFTLMRLGPERRATLDRREDVVASYGVHVAGDRFDAAIVEHKLLRRFGAGATYKPERRRIPLPAWLPRKLLAWHELSMLREKSTLEFLRKAQLSADDAPAVGNLIQLVEENLAYQLYRAVEAAKRELGDSDRATISFHEGAIDVEEKLTRAQFESWTAPLRVELSAAIEEVLRRAGGATPDAIFLTGGTSRIPSVRALFAARFGDERLRAGDSFTSVATGLGRAASRGD